MTTGIPKLGFRLTRTDCLCFKYHRPINTSQNCECECHLDEMDKRFSEPIKLTPYQRKKQSYSEVK